MRIKEKKEKQPKENPNQPKIERLCIMKWERFLFEPDICQAAKWPETCWGHPIRKKVAPGQTVRCLEGLGGSDLLQTRRWQGVPQPTGQGGYS